MYFNGKEESKSMVKYKQGCDTVKKMILIDGNSLMYRAYFATAYSGNLMQNSQGLYTNAIFAFANMIDKVLDKDIDHILVAFDTAKATFRHAFYDQYKAGRSPMPEEMKVQIPHLKNYLSIMGIHQYEEDTFEADDIIGTLARQASEQGYLVDIFSSDKDLLQLVNNQITVHLNKKGMTEMESYTPEMVIERYGLTHEQMIDLKALMGDASDNLPGIPGVGEKTAVKLLQEYGTLESIIAHQDAIKGKLGERVKEHADMALLCKKMVTIKQDVPLPLTLEDTVYEGIDKAEAKKFFLEMGFHSFLRKLERSKLKERNVHEDNIASDFFDLAFNETPDQPHEVNSDSSFTLITDTFMLKDILKNHMALILETFDSNYHKSEIVGIGLADETNGYFVPIDIVHDSMDFQLYLSDPTMEKYTYDIKKTKVALNRLGLACEGMTFDLLLGAYLVNPRVTKDDFKVVASHFDYDDVQYDEMVYGKGVKKALPDQAVYARHIAQKAKAIMALMPKVMDMLTSYEQMDLFQNVEVPLASVLADMEIEGIRVDKEELNRQRDAILMAITEAEEKVYETAGLEFNIGSPKQVGEVLFETLGLKATKKTKTGYSTDIDVLMGLKDKHPVISHIIKYRQLTKLYSTYIEGLDQAVFDDGKVHTIYQQALTATGRLSSIEPNLQNIPIRTEEGKIIRKMFVPNRKNSVLYAADYSQIELRVLAHMASVDALTHAFKHQEDIHENTAKAVFNQETVTKDMRRQAKAVNFGIIYGISAFSLSDDINVSIPEAQAFIDRYLAIYPGIKEYMEDTVAFAKEHGYVKTIMNRRRFIPELESKVYMQREFGKRTAMNAPIQGSAADIIKKAMVDIHAYLKKEKLQTKLLLQVHDELVLDVPKDELKHIEEVLPRLMTEAVKLDVPLMVDASSASTWYDVK